MTPDLTYAVRLCQARSDQTMARSRDVRSLAHVSQAAMARLVGVSVTTIEQWETGVCRPLGERALRFLTVIEALEGAVASTESAGHTTQVLAEVTS